MFLTRLVALLYNLGTDRIENRFQYFHQRRWLASRRLEAASLFLEPFPSNGQCLSSHITEFNVRKKLINLLVLIRKLACSVMNKNL
jgi:hypothetical protein